MSIPADGYRWSRRDTSSVLVCRCTVSWWQERRRRQGMRQCSGDEVDLRCRRHIARVTWRFPSPPTTGCRSSRLPGLPSSTSTTTTLCHQECFVAAPDASALVNNDGSNSVRSRHFNLRSLMSCRTPATNTSQNEGVIYSQSYVPVFSSAA